MLHCILINYWKKLPREPLHLQVDNGFLYLFLRYCKTGNQIKWFICEYQLLTVRNFFLKDVVLCACSQISFTFWEVSSELHNPNLLFCYLDCLYKSFCISFASRSYIATSLYALWSLLDYFSLENDKYSDLSQWFSKRHCLNTH